MLFEFKKGVVPGAHFTGCRRARLQIKRAFTTVVGCSVLSTAMPALAQTGRLFYSPNLNPIPTGSTVLYIVMAVALACLAFLALRWQRKGEAINSVGIFVLLGVVAISELWIGAKVYARVGNTQSFLSDPQGGNVVVVTGAQNFSNNSGVPMLVATLTPPCAAPNVAANACFVGHIVLPGDSCNTDFTCP